MRKIFKYPIVFGNDYVVKVKMPIDHQILSIKNQDERPVIYALVNTHSPEIEVSLFMFPTGVDLPDLWLRKYIDTVMFSNGKLVLHFFK